MTTLLDKVFGTYLGIEFNEDKLTLVLLKNSVSGISMLSSKTFPLVYGEQPSDDVRAYLSQHSMDLSKIFVSIPDRWAIIKFIDIPSMRGKGKGALANLMKFEVERHIPFEIDEVAFDFMCLDEKDGRETVVIVAAQKERVNFVKEYMDKLSLQPDTLTTASFAVLNSIELGGMSAGGWQEFIGIVRKSDVLGRKGEINIAIYVEPSGMTVALVIDGLCTHLRTMALHAGKSADDAANEIAGYLNELLPTLAIEEYNKIIIAGDTASNAEFCDALQKRVAETVIYAAGVETFSGKIKGVEMNGMSPCIGACYGGLGIGTYRINLLPHKTDYELGKVAPLAAKVFMVLVLVMLVGIFSVDAYKQKVFLEKMDAALSENEPEVKALEALLAEINELKDESRLLRGIEENETTLEILAELTAIMPSDSWITNLHFKGIEFDAKRKSGDEVIINGYAASSSALIPLLEDSPYFEKVEFVGPIKKTRNKEQFKLSAKIVRSADREGDVK